MTGASFTSLTATLTNTSQNSPRPSVARTTRRNALPSADSKSYVTPSVPLMAVDSAPVVALMANALRSLTAMLYVTVRHEAGAAAVL